MCKSTTCRPLKGGLGRFPEPRHRTVGPIELRAQYTSLGATCLGGEVTAVAIMFVRAQVISRGAGRSIVSAAAYRHRARMLDEQVGTTFSYRGGAGELKHEELALPDQIPAWLQTAIAGKTVAAASEALWNAVDAFETRSDAQLARELIIALPEELTRAENIALVQEFVRETMTSEGMIADWVYHDKDGNPHIHLMTALRPLTEKGFGPKKVAVLGASGQPLRVVTPDRPNGKIVYKLWAGDKETMKAWKIAWAETANRHLALAGHDIRLDGRSYAEQGLDGIAQRHLGPEKAALARKGVDMYFAPADLARRQEMADRLLADPALLLKQLGNERSTFDEKDIAKALHRYVDDPIDFANIRARVMASDELVLLRPQQADRETAKVAEPAIFTTRAALRIEYDMAQSADTLSKRNGFKIADSKVAAAVHQIQTADREKPFKLDTEQVAAVRHVTGESAIAVVVGLAGAGKSTLLAAARVAWEGEGRRVLGAALAGKAAEGLEDSSGIKSRTLASWELAWENGRDLLERGNVFVIDEAGMVSSQQMARVLKAVENAGAKAVLIGDAMQLQPIQAGAAFRAISERIGFCELSGVRRQREAWARDASRLFARGRVEEALDAYAQRGCIIEAARRSEIFECITADWSAARQEAIARSRAAGHAGRLRGDEMLVLAHTNDDVKRLNEELRGVMNAAGALTDARSFQTMRGVREFASGDRIIFLENARFLEKRARVPGPQYVKNGMLGTVVSTGDKRGGPLLSVRLDNGHDIVISEDSYRNVDHGYAATIHKSQGATVDRTFVLATSMMDHHLTYVSMTRHRDQATLYAAREDFEAKPEWGRRKRVDHAIGVTGTLVMTGAARFRPDDEGGKESPYADVRTDDGAVHRVWGVSLPNALEKGGICEGDTVTLRKDGVETVTVDVVLTDPETGEKRTQKREVHRNVWTAKLVEAPGARKERIDRESHRPELFKQMVARLGRSAAKTTTLDFEGEIGYQTHVHDFARRRGIDTLAEIAARHEEATVRRLVWLAEKKVQVATLWQRASVALGFAIEREKSFSYKDTRSETIAAPVPMDRPCLIPATTRFDHSIEEDARRAQLASHRWREREAVLRPVLERIYRDPDEALVKLNDLASNADLQPRRLAEDLAAIPQRLGRMRGSDLLVDGRAARDERGIAMTALKELVPLARAHATEFRRQDQRFAIKEQHRRAHMSFSIPALSKPAMARLLEIEAIRERGGPDAYKTAFAYAAQDRLLVQEVKAVDEALTARFGWSAFTERADTIAERNMVERMPDELAGDRRKELARLFSVVRRFAREQHLAERMNRSNVVAGASVEPAKERSAVLPMLAAVTEFMTSVEDEARIRARETAYVSHNRTALVEAAGQVWRDPVEAVKKIEALILKGIEGGRLAVAVANDPAAYGALRGSSRIVDRLLAAGRERKNALQAVPEAAGRVRALSASYASALAAEIEAITEQRQCMAVVIHGLSPAADEALRQIEAEMKKKDAKLDAAARSIEPRIREELARISRSLDLRFGRDAILRGEVGIVNRLSPAQRRPFEAMQERLRILQRIVRMGSSQQIVAERQRRKIDHGRDIVR